MGDAVMEPLHRIFLHGYEDVYPPGIRGNSPGRYPYLRRIVSPADARHVFAVGKHVIAVSLEHPGDYRFQSLQTLACLSGKYNGHVVSRFEDHI
jgi:hypothetical protein